MTEAPAGARSQGLLGDLVELLGPDRVLTGAWERQFFATDIFSGSAVPTFVVRPQSAESLAIATRPITAAGLSVVGRGAKPFFRYHGPDVTGLFLGDCGAPGIKTRTTLRLMRRPAEVRMASSNFVERAAMSGAMAALGLICNIKSLVNPGRLVKPKTLGLD